MTALWVIASPIINGTPFAIAADDENVHYVYPTGFDTRGAADDERILTIIEAHGIETPTTARDWLVLASTGFTFFAFGDTFESESLEQAVTDAQDELDTIVGKSPREQALQHLAEAHERHVLSAQPVYDPKQSKDSPDYNMWAADLHADPEDELMFQLDVMGEVRPDAPHRWLPFKINETECAFCDLLEDAEIHAGL